MGTTGAATRTWLPWALVSWALLTFVLFQWATVHQYHAGQVRGDAVQVFDMMLSRFVAGEGMIQPTSRNHFFTNHVMLWLYPASLLYVLHDNIFSYLTPLNLGLAFAVIPFGLLVWRKTRSVPLVAAAALFFSVNTLTASLRQSIHPESLLIAPWLLLFLAVESRRRWLALAAALLVLSVKEDQPLWLLIYAAWALWFRRGEKRTVLAIGGMAASALFVYTALQALLPRPGGELESGYFWIVERYGGVAETPWGLAGWFLTNPGVILDRFILNPMWLLVFASGAIISLVGWRPMLLLVPPAGLLFSAEAEIFSHLYYYYAYPLLPPLLYALAEGLGVLTRRFPTRAVRHALVAWLVVFSGLHFWMPTRVEGWRQWPRPLPLAERARIEAAREFVQQAVPRDRMDLKAATHYDLGAFVPRGRQILQLWPREVDEADMVLLDLRRVSIDLGRERYRALLEELFAQESGWQVTMELDGLVALERTEQSGDED